MLILASLLPLCGVLASASSNPYPPWGNGHLVWLSSDQSNQENVTNMVEGYKAHKIPVSAVNIDSAWSTGINNFGMLWVLRWVMWGNGCIEDEGTGVFVFAVVDQAKFPDFKGLSKSLHGEGLRMTMWATSMVDTDSPNYQDLLSNGGFIRDAFGGVDPLHWWHGDGLLVDLTLPGGQEWFGKQVDHILPLVDGFKVDGTDPFILEYLLPLNSENKSVTYDDYRIAYYGWFFNYIRLQNPEGLIMGRPVDSYFLIGQDVSIFLNFSCRWCCYAGWVGDQDPTFEGLTDALTNIIWSGWAGFVSFGSDTGGYRTGPGKLGRTAELFLRWAGVNAFLPFFENGGDKEHRPWVFDEGTGKTFVTDSYRTLVAAHLELQPYLLAQGAIAKASNFSIIHPRASPVPYIQVGPGKVALDDIEDFSYLLGPDYYVVPVNEANVTEITVRMPEGKDAWSDWNNPNRSYPANATVHVPAPLGSIPVFVRQNSISPLHVSTPYAKHGLASSAGALTLFLNHPTCPGTTHTPIVEYEAPSASATATCHSNGTITLSITPLARDIILMLHRDSSSKPITTISHTSQSTTFTSTRTAPLHFPTPTTLKEHVAAQHWPYSPLSPPSLREREANLANEKQIAAAKSLFPPPEPFTILTNGPQTLIHLGSASDGFVTTLN